ncbi:MAG: efflux RND transporter permease subunit [Kofleriaceae bacterium]
MQWLSSISVRRPVFATVMILTLVVVGLVGYAGLGVDKFPKVDFPMVTITSIRPGAAPSAIESDITDKIEAAVNTVSGIELLSSISTEGASLVIAQFVLDKHPSEAAQEVQERINGILSDLPDGVRPEVKKADPDAAPVIVLAIKAAGEATETRELTRVADTIVRRQIEGLADVGTVRLIGDQERRINVDVDLAQLIAARVSALEVMRAISVSNVSVPGGRLKEGPTQATVRIEGRAVDPRALGDIVIREQADHPIRVRDVADIDDGAVDRESASIRNGEPTVALAVRKQTGTNTVEVVHRVIGALDQIRSSLPQGYSLEIVRDNSEMIKTSTDQVLEHLILGSLLASLVVLLFLGSLRSTFIAAIAIPVSIIATFALMSYAGFTLNLMSLLALALAVGIVIDDAIVVLENIYRFIDEKGMKPFPAAIQATKEIGLAVLATTLSLMAVFLPVAFMSGIVGRFLLSFGLTMAFAIGVSLVVSFTLTPMMAARLLPPPPPPGTPHRRSLLQKLSDVFYRPIEWLYVKALRFVLRHRWVVVVACIGTCATVPTVAGKVGFGFLPLNDEAQFEIYVRTAEGTTLEETSLVAERIARGARAIPEVTSTLVSVADSDQRQQNVAWIYVRLSDPIARTRSQAQVMDTVRQQVLVGLPDGTKASAELVNDFSIGTKNAMVSYIIKGPDLDKLEQYSRQVIEKMEKVPGVVDLDSSMVDPTAEVVLRPNLDRAADLGVDPADVTATLGLLLRGSPASVFEDRGEQYDVFVRAREEIRTDASALSLLTVPSRTLGHVPLSEVVSREPGTGPSQITRTGRQRSVTISCNVSAGGVQGDIMTALQQAIDDLDMPPGYTAEPFGQSKEQAKMGKAFGFAFLLSFIFMYLVLAAQFESWLHPFTIIMALPLTLPFALFSLLIFDQQLNIFSMLGLLVLFGVVKKNAILQVDQANQLRARGMPRFEAVLEANRERLRPILMTTLAFVAGMLPLVFSHGIGSGFSKAMAGIIVGGQVLSLVLTLLAIPVLYTLLDDAKRGGSWFWRKTVARRPVDRGASEVGLGDPGPG